MCTTRLKIKQTCQAFYIVNVAPNVCISARNNSLWSRTSNRNFVLRPSVSTRIERPLSAPFPLLPAPCFSRDMREGSLSDQRILPPWKSQGERRAQRARNSLCARKCIKDESVIYRVHAQNSRDHRSCVREEKRRGGRGGGRVVGWITWWCDSRGGVEGRARSRSLRLSSFCAPRYNLPRNETISLINIDNAR